MDNNNDFIENNDNNSVENSQNETAKKKKIIIGAVAAAVVIIAVIVAAVMLTSNNNQSEGVEGTDGVSQSDVSNTQESTTVKPGEYVIVDTESTTGSASSNSNGSNQNNSSSGNQNGSQSGGDSGETSNEYNPDDSEDNDDDEEVLVKRKVTAYIELPNDGGASDILEIYVNGELQKFGEESGVPVNINGKTVIFTTDKEYEGVVRIEAKLKSYGTSASQITTKNGNTVSFALPLDSSEENFGKLD